MKQKKQNLAITAILALLIIAIGYLYRQNRNLKSRIQSLQLYAAQQSQVIDSIKSKGLNDLLSHVLNKVDTELQNSQSNTLSDETISRIAAFSFSSKPYVLVENDSLGSMMLSPERGQLLLMLMRMNIDTASLDKIMLKTTFANADLRKADLRRAYLKGANLSQTDMKDAHLENANLQKANLYAANLWGASLENAKMQEADLRRADLSWAVLNGAVLQKANLSSAKAHSAQIRKADIKKAVLRWTAFNGSFIVGSDLSNADLTGGDLSTAVLTDSRLAGTTFLRTNLIRTHLNNVVLSERDWIGRLKERLIKGASEIESNHTIDSLQTAKNEYLLKPKKSTLSY